jgi:protoporphyrinogen oxidase
MKKSFKNHMNEINENIKQVELMLKESMGFCEDESFDETDMEDETFDDDFDADMGEMPLKTEKSIEPYIEHIRKYSLNGLSALCDNPESEEYQMLKKIFQMCDKKPEKKDNIAESHRLFGIMKDSKNVLFETHVENIKDFKNLKNTLINEAKKRGYNPNNIRLVSENKIIC